MIVLRQLAKQQRIAGYSRMNKATLLERVEIPTADSHETAK